MAPRKKQYRSAAERVAAHRARQARAGRSQMNVVVSGDTAAWLKAEARRRGVAVGALLDEWALSRRQVDESPPAVPRKPATRSRVPRADDPGVEVRQRRQSGQPDCFDVVLAGEVVAYITRERAGYWLGTTVHGDEATGRTGNATVNRLLMSVHHARKGADGRPHNSADPAGK